ncbi:MAG: tetratricopeptide repeat protein [Acidobacteriota bacterium]|nr:tetratricopeptide repeat protein [Blastocatellia bacterium]MDW8411645.1 tetratricopeptide repeat protein [Acidobacteriota bacterium]
MKIQLLLFFVVCNLAVAQEGPVIGRGKGKGSQPADVVPDNKKAKVGGRSGSSSSRGPVVPKGKPLDYYIRKSSELIDATNYTLALQYLDEAARRRKDKSATPELIELLDKQQQVAKLHLEVKNLPKGSYAQELALYQQILLLRPNDVKAIEQVPVLYKHLAEAALSQQKYDVALEYLEKLLRISSNSETREKMVRALLALGEAELVAGNEDAARRYFMRVTEYEPKNQKALDGLLKLDVAATLKFAENKLSDGAYEDALVKFREVLALEPNNEQAKKGLRIAQAHYQKQRGEQLYLNRKYLEAEREYKAAMDVLVEDGQIKQRLEEIALRLGPPLPARGRTVCVCRVAPGVTKLKLRGKNVVVEGDVSKASISERLPEVPYLIKRFKRLTGTAVVRQVEAPDATNGFTAVFALDTKKEEEVSFEIEWELRRQGIVSWSGQITGRAIVRVQGPFVDVEQVSGGKPTDVKVRTDGLPHQEVLAKVRKLSGKSEIQLIEQPSQANMYTVVLAVENEGTDSVAFEVSWQLK